MPAANGPLNAAVAALEAQPYPWFVPTYSIRLTDPAVYAALVATYGFGSPIIIGLSPDDAVTLTGAPLVSNSAYGPQQVRPEVYVHPDALNVLGVPITTAESGGTIFISYANALGRYDRVVWEWQCDVELDLPATDPTVTGKYEQQVVTWTGDGTSGRLIPTAFALDSGVVGVWICGGANGTSTTDANCFRHNQSSMGGTAVMGISGAPFSTQGIMTFTASGFTVTDGASSATFANTLNAQYVAVVLRDTTSDNHWLRVGTYKGWQGGSFGVLATHGSSAITYFSGVNFSPYFDGVTVQDAALNSYTFTYISPTSGSISPGYIPATANPVTLSFVSGPRVIAAPSAGTVKAIDLTHLWIWGQSVAYKSFEVPTDTSMTLISSASGAAPVSSMITALSSAQFSITDFVNANRSVNTFNVEYDYLALAADAALLAAAIFASFTGTGSGPPTVITGIGFTPGLVFGRQGGAVFSGGGVWRGSTHTGTHSTECSNIGSTNNLNTTGITALGAGTTSFDVVPAPVGDPYYGWAFLTGEVDIPAVPGAPYVPGVSGYVPNGGLLVGQGLGAGHTGPCGCSLLE